MSQILEGGVKFRSKVRSAKVSRENHARHLFTSRCALPLPTESCSARDHECGQCQVPYLAVGWSEISLCVGSQACNSTKAVCTHQCVDHCSILRFLTRAFYLGMMVLNKRSIGVLSAIVHSRVAPSAVSSKATTAMPQTSLLISAIEGFCSH